MYAESLFLWKQNCSDGSGFRNIRIFFSILYLYVWYVRRTRIAYLFYAYWIIFVFVSYESVFASIRFRAYSRVTRVLDVKSISKWRRIYFKSDLDAVTANSFRIANILWEFSNNWIKTNRKRIWYTGFQYHEEPVNMKHSNYRCN